MVPVAVRRSTCRRNGEEGCADGAVGTQRRLGSAGARG